MEKEIALSRGHAGCVLLAILWLASVGFAAPASAQGVAAVSASAGKQGAVASSNALASQVGVTILKRGGNAVDAACAVGFALAVTHPIAGNLGGGGFMLIRLANGKSVAIDYREMAPGAATKTMYLDSKGEVVPNASLVGYRSSGVPGSVAGMGLAQQKYGALKWRDVLEPARRLAAEGFPVTNAFAHNLRTAENLAQFPESKRVFLKDGKFYQEGEIFRQPELAATLHRLQENGSREFYEGRTAQLLADDMKANNGLITLADLKNYKAVEREPLRGTYRGYEVLTMPPPSSGGIALLEMLNMLEPHDLGALGYGSAATDHLLIETMRRAFADRAAFLGDADFVKVPVQGLITKSYAADVARTIDLAHATPSNVIGHGQPPGYESMQTTHYSVMDAQGNAVAVTTTLNDNFGSSVTVKGAGFLLNDEMDDFTSKPGVPNLFGLIQSEANAIAPRKRPLSSMTPTILVRNGKSFLVIGSPGGPTIITTVLQTIVNVVDHKMGLREAIAMPRLHHQWLPDQVRAESFALPKEVRDTLTALGHRFSDESDSAGRYWGDAEGILIDPLTGERFGASDPRSADARAIAY